MQTLDVKTWEELEAKIRTICTGEQFLFRGQGNSCWLLTATLDRNGKKGMRFRDYYRLISRVRPQLETFTGINWDIPTVCKMEESLGRLGEFDSLYDLLAEAPAVYGYMIYLRHHGFPSPLLDWTRSPHVAAYFAFKDAPNPSVEQRSVFVLGEPKDLKCKGEGQPRVDILGPYIRSHRRHFLQQGDYTVCTVFERKEWRFDTYPDQDLWKFNIPSTERLKILKSLDDYNLNAFSLFNTEDSLMETMALRELGFKA